MTRLNFIGWSQSKKSRETAVIYRADAPLLAAAEGERGNHVDTRGIWRIVVALTAAATLGLFAVTVAPPTASATGDQGVSFSLGASPVNVVSGQPVTLSVSLSGSFGTPTGTVTFEAANPIDTADYTLCVATLHAGSGTCQATDVIGQEGGADAFAAYSGDATYSSALQSLPLDATPADTTMTLTSNADPTLPGSDTTFTASISFAPPGSVSTLSGNDSVMFTLSEGAPGALYECEGAVTLDPQPVATCSIELPAGTYTVTAQDERGYIEGWEDSSATMIQYVAPPPHGYWLVGGDGGIFTFGSAQFHGSTGSLQLSRPVVGITPTNDRDGYWLVASDGGIFSFGDAGFYGSIPGLGYLPAGTPGNVKRLNAPVVGMVPSTDGGGYFMVASDGGVFAFGDAKFEGSCPAIGGCIGAAVAVMPDASGNGYWLVTDSGHVYSFGDAVYHGAPPAQSSPVTSAVRTPDGGGYWILFANGDVSSFGDATSRGGLAAGIAGGVNPATSIFSTDDGQGYWVATANGAVYPLGDAPDDGSMAGQHLNAPIIAAVGW